MQMRCYQGRERTVAADEGLKNVLEGIRKREEKKHDAKERVLIEVNIKHYLKVM